MWIAELKIMPFLKVGIHLPVASAAENFFSEHRFKDLVSPSLSFHVSHTAACGLILQC